ncbi:MAG: hypothetical protein IJW40_01455 [Clostridia bacterium]|nr:hypothetical protein [Clostridia bacterium]
MGALHCIIYLGALGLLSHVVGEALPRRWFDEDKIPWRSAAWEKNGAIYQKLHIRAWQGKLPDKSRFVPGMLPKRLPADCDATGVEKLIKETCVAEAVHEALIVSGMLCVAIWQGAGGVTMALLFGVGNIPYVMIQRHNRPRLVRLQRWLARRDAHMEEPTEEPTEGTTNR